MMEPLMILFAGIDDVTFVCFGCGIHKTQNKMNEIKFKSFVKLHTTKEGECINCKSTSNLFRNKYGEQFWINSK